MVHGDGLHPHVGALDVAPVVYRDDAEHGPAVATALTAATLIGELGIPVFGICYGFQAMARALGGTVARTGLSEFGGTPLRVVQPGTLFAGLPADQNVWMSHGDSVAEAPTGFLVTAHSDGAPIAAFEDVDRRLAGVQFHPEVLHSEHGQKVLEHFLYDIAKLEPTWTASNVIDEQVESIRAQVGDKLVICGLSGGVDSAVAAALVHKAVGDQLTCVFVDHGLMRAGERQHVDQETEHADADDDEQKLPDNRQRGLHHRAGHGRGLKHAVLHHHPHGRRRHQHHRRSRRSTRLTSRVTS